MTKGEKQMRLIPILAMHIPDGFLSVPVAAVGWMWAITLIGFALRHTRSQLGERQVPFLGVLAAFVFAAQMINFPVAGGTSGHLIGGVLIAILLGPWATVLVMTSVVIVQALLFQDGGLLALGFNVFNMGILAPFAGYSVYTGLRKILNGERGQMIAVAAAAWCSVEAAAAATTLELVVSGTSPLTIALPAMIGVHALIGLGEALITVGALTFIRQTRPDLVDNTRQSQGSHWIAVGLLIALVVAFASPLASSDPDGLERVAEDHEFLEDAKDAPYSLLPDYTIPGVDNKEIATVAAGIVGVLIVAGVGYGVSHFTKQQSDSI
jgi:cobalt/nickel transport system permease protein